MSIQLLLNEYNSLRKSLTINVGFEESVDELMYNESILEGMENLLKDVNPDVAKLIRLNLI